MKTNGKKKLFIVISIIVAVLILGIVGLKLAVDIAFSKVTDSVANTGVFTSDETGVPLTLPEVSDNTLTDGVHAFRMDADRMKKISDAVSFSDKMAVLSILSQALPKEEYSKVMGVLTGKITQEGVNEVYTSLKTHLSDSQKQDILRYYAKYAYLLDE